MFSKAFIVPFCCLPLLAAACGSAPRSASGPAPAASSNSASNSASPAVLSPAQPEPAPKQVAAAQDVPDPRKDPNAVAAQASDTGHTEGSCTNPAPPPPRRKGGSLIVESPPRKITRSFAGRMRSHIDGALSARTDRFWVGPDVPSFIPITVGTLELFILDPVVIDNPDSTPAPDGFLAYYRDPYDASSCGLGGNTNCAVGAALYHCSGKLLWVHHFKNFMSKPTHLEVQDVRYDRGVLYFNEACQSYSKEAGGQCSALIAVDPKEKKVLWRTKPLISNNRFLVHKKYIITGYGFTAEPDFLYVIRKSDGSVVQKISVPTSHEEFKLEGDRLTVSIYGDKLLLYRLDGFEGDKPKLVRLPDPPPAPVPSSPGILGTRNLHGF